MKNLNVKLEADNLAQAEVVSASERTVYVKLDAREKSRGSAWASRRIQNPMIAGSA